MVWHFVASRVLQAPAIGFTDRVSTLGCSCNIVGSQSTSRLVSMALEEETQRSKA